MQYQDSPFEHYLYSENHGGFSLQASVRRSENKHTGGSDSLFKFQSHIIPAGLVMETYDTLYKTDVMDGGVIPDKLFNDLFESVAVLKPRKLTKKKRT